MTNYVGWIRVELNYEIEAESVGEAFKQLSEAVEKIESLELSGEPAVMDYGVDKDESTDQSLR